jgi:crossover junction endodeoxyribonuclease RusA
VPTLTIEAAGRPIPQGSIAYKGHRGGRPLLVSDNTALAGWRRTVVEAAHAALPAGWTPLDEPVRLLVAFYLPRPQRPRFPVPATKPDGDKLERAIFDALEAAGVVVNDSRIYEVSWRARYENDRHPVGATVVVSWGDVEV